jgi:phosphoribosylglycinamide formyltransferase 1
MAKTKIGILISGGGSNLQAIIDSCEAGALKGLAEVAVVISNKREAFGLERAKKHNIPALFVDPKQFADPKLFCGELVKELKKHKTDILCLAGFLLKLDSNLVKEFKGRLLNIHPALLPKFGGKGMYGHHVHEAVIRSGENCSGATVHFVDEEYDHGSIIKQETVQVLAGDTPEALAARILKIEHKIYPEAILKVITELRIKD